MPALAPLVLLCILVLTGCAQSGGEHAPGASGATMFGRYCARCHGLDGAGNFLAGVPSNRSTALDPGAIADRIRGAGDQHRRMPSFPQLTRKEALDIAHHVLALRKASGGAPAFWEHGIAPAAPDPSPR